MKNRRVRQGAPEKKEPADYEIRTDGPAEMCDTPLSHYRQSKERLGWSAPILGIAMHLIVLTLLWLGTNRHSSSSVNDAGNESVPHSPPIVATAQGSASPSSQVSAAPTLEGAEKPAHLVLSGGEASRDVFKDDGKTRLAQTTKNAAMNPHLRLRSSLERPRRKETEKGKQQLAAVKRRHTQNQIAAREKVRGNMRGGRIRTGRSQGFSGYLRPHVKLGSPCAGGSTGRSACRRI